MQWRQKLIEVCYHMTRQFRTYIHMQLWATDIKVLCTIKCTTDDVHLWYTSEAKSWPRLFLRQLQTAITYLIPLCLPLSYRIMALELIWWPMVLPEVAWSWRQVNICWSVISFHELNIEPGRALIDCRLPLVSSWDLDHLALVIRR